MFTEMGPTIGIKGRTFNQVYYGARRDHKSCIIICGVRGNLLNCV